MAIKTLPVPQPRSSAGGGQQEIRGQRSEISRRRRKPLRSHRQDAKNAKSGEDRNDRGGRVWSRSAPLVHSASLRSLRLCGSFPSIPPRLRLTSRVKPKEEKLCRKGLKEPKEVLVAAFVKTRPPQGARRRPEALTTEGQEQKPRTGTDLHGRKAAEIEPLS